MVKINKYRKLNIILSVNDQNRIYNISTVCTVEQLPSNAELINSDPHHPAALTDKYRYCM